MEKSVTLRRKIVAAGITLAIVAAVQGFILYRTRPPSPAVPADPVSQVGK